MAKKGYWKLEYSVALFVMIGVFLLIMPVSIENNRQAVKVVENNVSHCKLADRAKILQTDAVSFLMRNNSFDIVFLDPPYHMGLVEKCLSLVLPKMTDSGIVVCETAADETLPECVEGWSAQRSRRYGKTKLTLYRKD